MTVSLAKLDQVSVIRRKTAILSELSLVVEPGDFWGIVGPNGAGKSTLLRLLAGESKPDRGQIQMLVEGHSGLPATPAETRRRAIGILLQHHNFSTHVPFTVRDIVAFGRVPHHRFGGNTGIHKAAIDAAISALGLNHFENRLYNSLSGGEQQKVQIARLIAQAPRLVLLDEPTAGLDLDWQERLTALVAELHTKHRQTVVMVTHDIDRLPACCTKVLLLKSGSMIASGPTAAVLTSGNLSRVYGCQVDVIPKNGRFTALT